MLVLGWSASMSVPRVRGQQLGAQLADALVALPDKNHMGTRAGEHAWGSHEAHGW